MEDLTSPIWTGNVLRISDAEKSKMLNEKRKNHFLINNQKITKPTFTIIANGKIRAK